MRVAATAVAILAGCVLAGCASSDQSTSAGSGAQSTGITAPGMGGTARVSPPTAVPSASAAALAASCPTKADSANSNDPAAKVIPTGITVSWVLRCTVVSSGGVAQQVLAERSVTSPDALLRALQTPSAQRAKVVCPMFVVYLPHFSLVEPDGTVLVPKVPLNNCGQPQNAVVQALRSMKFDKLATRSLK